MIVALIALSTGLVDAVARIAQSRRDKRDRVAEYCQNIASCLRCTQEALERGEVPHGKCSEMQQYICDLRDVLGGILPPTEYAKLWDALAVSYHIEHMGEERWTRPGRTSKFPELGVAAGRFDAVASRLRSTN